MANADKVPRIGGQFILDKSTAMTNCQAILAALVARDRGAGGQHIDVSMINNGIAWGWPDDWYNSLWVDSDASEAPLAQGDTVILHCHWLSFVRGLHSDAAVTVVIFCRHDRVAPG